MDTLQKRYFWYTFFILAVTIACALLILSGEDLQYMTAFFHLFARYDLPGAMLLIAVLCTGLILSPKLTGFQVEKVLSFFQKYPFRISLIAILVMALCAVFIYHRHPLCMDEYLPYFQSRIFAEGKFWGQFPTELVPWLLQPHFFSVFSPETGRVVSDYWPGFALLLTPFTKLNLPWLLNPVLSGVTLLLFYYYIEKILPGPFSGAWGILLTISSSVFWVNGISFYSMSAHLFFNLVYATLLLEPTLKRIFMAGIVGSFALVLHNPVPHICFALPWIAWLGFNKRGVENIGALIAGYLPLALLLGVGWVWLKMEIAKGGPGILVQGTELVQNTAQNLINTNPKETNGLTLFSDKILGIFGSAFKIPDSKLLWARLLGWLKLFGWSLPGLPVLSVLGMRHIKGNTHLKLWAWSAALTLGIFIFVPFTQGHGWGFRYFHSAWFALPLLATAFLTAPSLKNAQDWKKLICVISLSTLIFSTGLRFYQVHEFISQHLSQLPVVEKKNKEIICIMNTGLGYYIQDLIQNDPFLRDSDLTLRSLGRKKDLTMMRKKFPKAEMIETSQLYKVWEIKNSKGTTN
jgi:hypothetical protein